MARSTTLAETPSQTAGPYVQIGLLPRFAGLKRHPHQLGNGLGNADEPGERIRIEGHLLDGNGAPVGDGLIEVWQAGAGTGDATIEGAAGSGTRGWGRLGSRARSAPGTRSTPRRGRATSTPATSSSSIRTDSPRRSGARVTFCSVEQDLKARYLARNAGLSASRNHHR